MGTLTIQKVSRAGLISPTMTQEVATANDKFVNDGKTILYYENTTGSILTVAITAVKTCSQGQAHNISVAVPVTTGKAFIGPFPVNQYNDANGYVNIVHTNPAAGTKVVAVSYIDG